MKSLRLSKIIEIVENNDVYTQEHLLKLLGEQGFSITQATISRDIKELNLVKIITEDGKYKYTTTRKKQHDNLTKKYHSVFLDSVISVDFAQNIIVLKCHTGMANAACAALDTMHFEGMVGTLAGDDTIFVLMRSERQAQGVAGEIREFLSFE